MTSQYRALILAAMLAFAKAASADPAPFDLAGPNLDVTVTRGGKTLPISEVPNLLSGDRLWIKADLPSTQSAHYLMVLAVLRGSTNPPPADWFFRCETWKGKCAQEGLNVTVPQDAQQMLVFLAPQTSGDFKTLVNAVRARPGVFVRSSQDLNQATLDRSRLESYLVAIRSLSDADPTKLQEAAPLLARSLAIKVDEKCLERAPQLQAPCLMQGQASLILDDLHSTSIVEALTMGPAGDLAMQASSTAQLGYGYYSPYVASVMDIARIFDSFRTAQYQYIPALTAQHGNELALTLNTPPSFQDPKSVLVAALPAVERSQPPPLHAANPKELLCARKTALIVPVAGAPLVFSTDYAHEVVLNVSTKDHKSLDLPAKADPVQGGFVVNTSALNATQLDDNLQGAIHGYWGFEKYDGPSFRLVNTRAQSWELVPGDQGALIVGREDVVHLRAGSVACIDRIVLKDPAGKELKATWRGVSANEVEVRLPLQTATPGALTLAVTQYGASEPQSLELRAFSEAGHIDLFSIHAEDSQGILKGTRLDEVAGLVIKGIDFAPGKLSRTQSGDELSLVAPDAQAVTTLKQGDATASITLKDGRAIELKTLVGAPRPSAALIGKSVQPSALRSESNILLSDQNELPQDAKLTFSVRAKAPTIFGHDDSIEVATADESFSTALTIGNGAITLENSNVAVAKLNPTKAFGSSAFGPLKFRLIANGVMGDWHTLATLVRLPVLKELKCPATTDLPCKLFGSDLFLVDSVSSEAQFTHPVQVPDGYTGYSLSVPHPTDGELFVKLRDDPSAIHAVALATQELPAAQEPAHLAARPSAAAAASAPVPDPEAKPPTAGTAAVLSASPTAPASAPVAQPKPPQL
jgi:hypothetical protein